MADSFLAFVTAVTNEVSNSGNTKSPAAVRAAAKHALSRVSGERVAWNEAEFSFQSTAGASVYSVGTVGFPLDVVEFDVVEVQTSAAGNSYTEIRPATLLDIRSAIRSARGSGAPYPTLYTWYADQLMFDQLFTAIVTVRGFYQRDARRDLKTGATIDGSTLSDALTNPWIDRGEDPLWAKTLEIYHARFARDDQAVVYYERQYEKAMKGLRKEWSQRAGAGMRVEGYLGAGMTEFDGW